AAASSSRDRAEALRAVTGDRFDVGLGLAAGHERVDGHDDEEEDRGADEDERHDRVEEVTVGESAAPDVEVELTEVRLTGNRDDGGDEVLHQGGHDRAERRADHDRHRKIYDVAAQRSEERRVGKEW